MKKEKLPKETKKKDGEKPRKRSVKAKPVEVVLEGTNEPEQMVPVAVELSPNGAASPEVVAVTETVVMEEYDPPRELIEARAYELFAQRGYVHGYHLEDWLTAENELKSKHRSA